MTMREEEPRFFECLAFEQGGNILYGFFCIVFLILGLWWVVCGPLDRDELDDPPGGKPLYRLSDGRGQ